VDTFRESLREVGRRYGSPEGGAAEALGAAAVLAAADASRQPAQAQVPADQGDSGASEFHSIAPASDADADAVDAGIPTVESELELPTEDAPQGENERSPGTPSRAWAEAPAAAAAASPAGAEVPAANVTPVKGDPGNTDMEALD